MPPGFRPAWVEVDLAALRHNVAVLRDVAAPAEVMAVVKADAYGHGAGPVARAAVEAGAAWLGVALVEEGVALREAGVDAPVMVLSEPPPEAASTVVAQDLTPVVYTLPGIEALAKAATGFERRAPFAVHLKVDTGMHRVGCSVRDAPMLLEAILDHDELALGGVCTHFAVADDPDDGYTAHQLARFDALLHDLAARGLRPPIVHTANSAATIMFPDARRDLVRCGIAVYGIAPSPHVGPPVDLQPVLSFKTRVTHVKRVAAGERISYGLRYRLARDATIATIPVGYADGVPRNLGHVGGEVLVRGRRHPIAGTVTMDQLMVDVGDARVDVDDEVVLIGRQGDEEITATDWAERLGTIPYEVVCGIGARVPRGYR
ncbi:MAG TPA: alanine racemase [Acidimicrobiia bacterium]|nr:alanine racemase [Acidimicrobiia bacterium]